LNISTLIDSVISLFIMILVGVYGSKKEIITSEINKGLINILVQIALPFMIVSSFIFTYDDTIKSNIINTFYYSLLSYLLMALVSYLLLLPVKNDKKTIIHFANVFTNTGYVGFPILYSIYRAEGVIYGSIFNMFFVIFVWTYGLMLYKGNLKKKDLMNEILKVLLNPSIIAVILGIMIMVFNLQLPNALITGMKNIGNMTGPLSMLIIGVILSKVKIKQHLKDWPMYYGITTKLVIIPLFIYLILFLMPGDFSKAKITVIIMTAMPASAMTSIFAETYDKEKDFAAVLVSITTLLSLFTVPILLRIIT